MQAHEPFSRRHGYLPPDREVSVREDAPPEFRVALLFLWRDELRLYASPLREIVCRVLLKLPDPSNWSEDNVWEEIQGLVMNCEWYQAYDLIEAIYKFLATEIDPAMANTFAARINEHFRSMGIGWQLVNGVVETRGPEAFESSVRGAVESLEATGRPTASSEIHQALQDLSRRPEPDLTGAIQHAMAALECVARDVCGDSSATLGSIMSKYPHLLPPPLPTAVEKIWGYTSEVGRHLKEGYTPSREEAELVVGLAASLASYLTRKPNKTG